MLGPHFGGPYSVNSSWVAIESAVLAGEERRLGARGGDRPTLEAIIVHQ